LGWAALYATNIGVLAVAILWTALLVREKERPTPTSNEKGEKGKPCYHPCPVLGKDFIKKTLSSFKELFRARPDGIKKWIVTLVLVLCVFQFITVGPGPLFFLLWKHQYKMTMAQYADMTVFLALRSCLANWALIPLLSRYISDTGIIIISTITSTVAITIIMLGETMLVFYISCVFFLFWNFGITGSRSILSKLVTPGEIGTAFAFIGILCKLTDLVSKPFYGFFYRATVAVLPGAFLLVTGGGFMVVLAVMAWAHFGLRRVMANGGGSTGA
jgi:PCFT/HCP family folate transporter-like MFS transporter 1/3